MQPLERALREKAHFDALATSVGSVWWGAQTKTGQLRLDERAALAIHHAGLSPGRRVLEPGAGNGDFTIRLARSGATIIGVEISPELVAQGTKRLHHFRNVEVAEGDIAALNFPDAFFDAIVGNSVLHHLDLDQALPEMVRVLAPGGRLFFCEPNMLNPQIAVEKNIAAIGRYLQNSPDETAFFRWQIKRKLAACGLTGISVVPFDFMHPGLPDRWIAPFMKLNKVLNRTPLIREIGGSLQIGARKPI